MPLDPAEDALLVSAIVGLEEAQQKLGRNGRNAPHSSVPIKIEIALNALRQLRPWWSEVDRRGLWGSLDVRGQLDERDFGRVFAEYPEGAEQCRAWMSRLEGALLAGRRPHLTLVPDGRRRALAVEVVARLPSRHLINEPTNWMRSAVAGVLYAVARVQPDNGEPG